MRPTTNCVSQQKVSPASRGPLATGKYVEKFKLLEWPDARLKRTARQFLNLAGAYEKMGRSQKAADTLKEALDIYPDSEEIARQLARLLNGSERGDESARVTKMLEARTAGW